MDTQRVRFLREIVVAEGKENKIITLEFSYDDGFKRQPRFFRVPSADLADAHQLYAEWGGRRSEGHRRGTVARRPDELFSHGMSRADELNTNRG